MQASFADLDGKPVPNAPRRLLQVNFVNTSTVLVRRHVLLALNGFDARLRYGEDLELWIRIAARHQVACVPTVQEVRVEHSTNVTKSIEPMLVGYVAMSEIIREWAGNQMMMWGVDANRYVAESLTDLGYWYFAQDHLMEARRTLWRSLLEYPTLRALLYLAASVLPTSLIDLVRALKSPRSPPQPR
jgi:hypothetical protein